ncbi:antibiotic biosynthesis monooxygenase family protein [Loigolactobacillus zhaoyuanensis]|uniref:Antibiotic biosynthesis monooxygenase n=1 Tax=Loigolactobacillus zhaoyuanensis TaxID=2486017 RepID=A0ABW8UCL7_9LACO|nr:antibiotic biosynthesis monooxygenase [Loigolactobacillus zhaoyuanensis]
MIHKIISAFGSQSILAAYLEREPQRHLLLLKPAQTEEDFQLLDLSDQPTFFNNPLQYNTYYHNGGNDLTGFFNFMYFDFASTDAAKVFRAQFDHLSKDVDSFIGLHDIFLLRLDAPQNKYVILSVWQHDVNYFNWRNSKDFQQMQPYLNAGPYVQQFHQTSYVLAQV